jgi:hypothetical protein
LETTGVAALLAELATTDDGLTSQEATMPLCRSVHPRCFGSSGFFVIAGRQHSKMRPDVWSVQACFRPPAFEVE